MLSHDEGVAIGVPRVASRSGESDERMIADRELGDLVAKIHEQSFGTYGTRRVTAELRLGLGREVNHKRVERLMRLLACH